MAAKEAPIRWAPKVRQDRIRRLYEAEAKGILDEELIDEVGWALYLRCRSILEVTEAVGGRVRCHGCGGIIGREKGMERVECPSCGWGADWKTYQKSYQDRQLFGGAALRFFQEYAGRFPGARSPREKLLMIDRLIHEFHWYHKAEQERPHAVRPTAANLIQGRGIREVVGFLDSLTYGGESAPETVRERDRWREVIGSNTGAGSEETMTESNAACYEETGKRGG